MGINQQADAALTIDFGHEVRIDQCARVTSGFSHDSYWQQVTLAFSDGSQEIFADGQKQPQRFSFQPRTVTCEIA